ncbi:hypothetical protein SADUNF_Sadunf04G0027800 [Salix dunnii]|uniref:Uncharacterized protein n=1 Tax=Salix dunnii TaxID=1413687 RepID=A0A835N3V1_9ROSI|nr:hypothetical protein SADUNF_Sadunf04G0027800 [Salix dunnii]
MKWATQIFGLASQKLRSWIPHLPSVWKPSWDNQEVWTDVLSAVLPQQCQGNRLHQVPLNGEPDICLSRRCLK